MVRPVLHAHAMPHTAPAPPALDALLIEQDGVVDADQLASHGITRNTVDKRVARGQWTRLLPSIFVTQNTSPTRRQMLVAAWLWGGPDSAVDGADALRWHGLGKTITSSAPVHIVVPGDSFARSCRFVVVRRSLAPICVADRGFVPYVDASSAAIVAARNAKNVAAAVALLSRALQQELVSVQDLAAARDLIGDKWCRPVDIALYAVGVGVRSPAERDLRSLILQSRSLPEPRWNQWLGLDDGGPPLCVDGLWDEAAMVNEVLGKKYHAWGEAYDKTNARKERLQAMGLEVCEATATRIRREGPVLLANLERIYARQPKTGLPGGVHLIEPLSIARYRP